MLAATIHALLAEEHIFFLFKGFGFLGCWWCKEGIS
jgi:hypothetical protein